MTCVRRTACSAALVVLALVVMGMTASGAVVRVSPRGPLSTVAEALRVAQPGDTVELDGGYYPEANLIVDKPLTIIGRNAPVIDGQGLGEVIKVIASGVTIRGLTIRRSAVGFTEDYAGIRLEKVFDCVIENNRLEDCFFAIYLAQVGRTRVTGNVIVGSAESEATSGNGIHLWYCREITVADNIVRNQRDGIYFEFVIASEIRRNRSEHNLRYGLHFMYSDSCTYAENEFRYNGAGVAVMYTRNVRMIDNLFAQNWGSASYGLLLKEITDSEIRGNVFHHNTIAMHVEGSNRVEVTRNIFRENGWAVRLLGNSIDNTFTQNNFMGNSFDVATNTLQAYSSFNSNFWSAYSGYDLDRDGFGDVPYRPVSLFSMEVARRPVTLVLLRSLFIDLLNLAERVVPTLTPAVLTDDRPRMRPWSW